MIVLLFGMVPKFQSSMVAALWIEEDVILTEISVRELPTVVTQKKQAVRI